MMNNFTQKSEVPALPEVPALELLGRYYPGQVKLSVADVARILRKKEQTIRNCISSKSFPIPSANENGGSREFDIRDVAIYLEQRRQLALEEEQTRLKIIKELAKRKEKSTGGRPTREAALLRKKAVLASLEGGAQ